MISKKNLETEIGIKESKESEVKNGKTKVEPL